MKKLLPLIFVALTTINTHVHAQIVNIPDSLFRLALIADGVPDSAGYILLSTAHAYGRNLDVHSHGIHDITGIEAFTSLHYFACDYNSITTLNISGLTQLDTFYCFQNILTSLDVSTNTGLQLLDCHSNNIAALDVSHNPLLTNLECSGTLISSLDVSHNPKLLYLGCRYIPITSLDVSADTALQILACFNNNLGSLDVSSCHQLWSLDCHHDSLTSLNIKNGNNHNFGSNTIYVYDNPGLTCIQVDDSTYSNANWSGLKDSTAIYSPQCLPTPVNNIANNAEVKMYPNPVSSQLIVETDGERLESITIYDLLGKVVSRKNATASQTVIDMHTLPAGIYCIRITDINQNVMSSSVVKD